MNSIDEIARRAVSSPVAPPPPVEAIRERAARHRRRRAATRVSVLACSVGLAIALVAVRVTGGDSDRPSVSVGDPTSSPVQSGEPPTVPGSCVVKTQNDPGCDMSPGDAAAYLGFEARVPDVLPAGWVVEREKLRVFRHPESDGVELFATFPAAVEIPVYNQIWTPPGEDLEPQGGCPSRLQVRQRPANKGETGGDETHSIDLDGHQLFGSELARPSSCGATTVASTMVFWIEDGIAFNVNAYNVDRNTIEQVIRSLFRH